MTIAHCPRRECQICLTDPFEENSTLKAHTWNGHSITTNAGLPAETRIIHGICEKCLPDVPVSAQSSICYTCRQPFPNGKMSLITVTKEGLLINETQKTLNLDHLSIGALILIAAGAVLLIIPVSASSRQGVIVTGYEFLTIGFMVSCIYFKLARDQCQNTPQTIELTGPQLV